jgi:hypothetical protein
VRVSFGPRFYATLSRYESKENDASHQPSGFSNIQVIIAANAMGDLTSDGRNRRGLGDVPHRLDRHLDRKSRGYEFEAVANLTPHWRLTLNAGLADASQTDAYRQTRAWIDAQTPSPSNRFSTTPASRSMPAASPPPSPASRPPTRPTWSTPPSTPGIPSKPIAPTGSAAPSSSTASRNTPPTPTPTTASVRGKLSGLRLGYGMQFRGPQVIGYRGADTMVNPANPPLPSTIPTSMPTRRLAKAVLPRHGHDRLPGENVCRATKST